jgi:hypothetical protein
MPASSATPPRSRGGALARRSWSYTATIDSDVCDWNTSGTSDDNSPEDIVISSSVHDDDDDDESFTCDIYSGCK